VDVVGDGGEVNGVDLTAADLMVSMLVHNGPPARFRLM
jgi:hypothetical protein